MKQNRGKDPLPITKYSLIAKTAGRCQMCNKYLLLDRFTMSMNDDSNMAHIVASSPNGPRGDKERSLQLSTDIENLMLLCREHHKLIDDHPEIYTESLLRDMKKAQEERVAQLGDSMNVEKTQIVVFQSPIKGKIGVKQNLTQIMNAIILKKQPLSPYGIPMIYEPVHDYHSNDYWQKAEELLHFSFGQVQAQLLYTPEITFSVFPLGPIPLIIRLGYMFGDKIKADVYQKFRSPNTWSWLSDKATNSFSCRKETIADGEKIAVIMALTSEIDISRVKSVYPASVVYKISASHFGVDCIQSEEDLSSFWHIYQEVCDDIRNSFPTIERIALFPSIPVSAAFSIGSRYMQGVYPQIDIYDEDDGFFKTISIGGK